MGSKGGGGGGTSVDVTADSTSTSTVDVVGLDNINADVTLNLPQPFTTDSTSTLDVKPLKSDLDLDTSTHLKIDPLKTDSSVSVDLKPAVIDLCLTANVGKLPNVCIRQPYQHHIGITLYGAEVWGISFSGEQTTVLEELDRQPRVAWGGPTTSWPPRPADPPPEPRPASRHADGLRIRLGP